MLGQLACLHVLLAAAPGTGGGHFPVVWNSKWPQDCADDGAPVTNRRAALLASFGVMTNAGAGYYGPAANDSINTMGAFGLWPHITSDGSRFNGGIPQRGNLSLHLERVRQDIERYMPSPLWAGAAVIDFEEWHPVYDANNYGPSGVIHADYRNESRVWVRTRNPNWTADAVEEEARHEFNAAAQSFMEQTLLLGKALRPHASWGYYGFPGCGKWRDETVCPRVGKGGGTAANDQLGWLWRASDALYPGIYLCCSTDHAARNASFVRAEMQEAHRVMAAVSVSLRIVPYIWPDWEDQPGLFMNRSTLEMLLSTIVEQGADGLVIWGAKPDAVPGEKCEEFESWLNATLGPLLEALPAHPSRWKSDEDDVDVLPPTHQTLPVPPGINASGFRSYAFTRRPDNATHAWFYDDGVLFESTTFDNGVTWEAPRKSLGCAVLALEQTSMSADGQWLIAVASNGKYAGSSDSAYVSTRARWNGTGFEWEQAAPVVAYRGLNGGGVFSMITLPSGRIVFSCQNNGIRNSTTANWTVHFPSTVSLYYTDDNALTWHQTSPISVPTYMQNYGAVEPCTVELPDGSLLTMMRTQLGQLWQSRTVDANAKQLTLGPATPAPFISNDSPAWIKRLSHPRWNGTAVLILWINSGTSRPGYYYMGRNHAGAVYPIRPFLHAAISTDGGATFSGHREVLRDALLAEEPPHGDYGVAYSNGIENEDGSVMFVSGQSAGHMGTMRIDPRWLLETGASANFSDSTAQGSWADTTSFTGDYIADCLFFPGVTPVYSCDMPAEQCPRCGDGQGVALRKAPDGSQALCAELDHTKTQATWSWNFPSSPESFVELEVYYEEGFSGANISLTDHYAPNYDNSSDGAIS